MSEAPTRLIGISMDYAALHERLGLPPEARIVRVFDTLEGHAFEGCALFVEIPNEFSSPQGTETMRHDKRHVDGWKWIADKVKAAQE